MNQYMLIYQGGDPDWMDNMQQEEVAASMKQWDEWMSDLAAKERLVSGGNPLHYWGKRVTPDGVITDIAASEFKELVSGYSLLKAENIEEACEFAKNCPIMAFPDIVVEVRQILEMD